MRRSHGQVEDIQDLAGLARTDKTMAFIMAMFMFSLAGIPPLAGFFGKYFVFLAAIKAGLVPLAVIGMVASVVGAYYYLRIVKTHLFRRSGRQLRETAGRGSPRHPARGHLRHRLRPVRQAVRGARPIGGHVAVPLAA